MTKLPLFLLCGALWIAPARADYLWEQAQRQQAANNYMASVRAYSQSQIDRNSRTFSPYSPPSNAGGAGRNWEDVFRPRPKPSYAPIQADDTAARNRWRAIQSRINTYLNDKPVLFADNLDLLRNFYLKHGMNYVEADNTARGEIFNAEKGRESAQSEAQKQIIAANLANYNRFWTPQALQEAAARNERYALERLALFSNDSTQKADYIIRFLQSKVPDPLPIEPDSRPRLWKMLLEHYEPGGKLEDPRLLRKWKGVFRREKEAESDLKIRANPRPADFVAWPDLSAKVADLMARSLDESLDSNARWDARNQIEPLLRAVWLDWKGVYLFYERTQAAFEDALYEFQGRLKSIGPSEPENDLKSAWNIHKSQFETAAEGGEPRAMAMLGEALMEGYLGDGSAETRQRGFDWILEAKDFKEPRALGIWSQQMFLRVQKDPAAMQDLAKRAFEAALEGAAQRDANSLRNVSIAYYHGWGTPKDVPKAVETAEVAARAGDLKSEEFLADHLYQASLAGDKSRDARLIEINGAMIARRDINAHALKAVMFYRGVAYGQDIPKAVALWRESAKIGNWSAARNLAKVTGLGIKGDTPQTSFASIGLEKALQTFEAHCDQNGAEQQYKLAMFYLNQPFGEPFLPEPDEARAKIWMQKAADNGSERAKALLLNYDEQVGVWLKALKAQKEQKKAP